MADERPIIELGWLVAAGANAPALARLEQARDRAMEALAGYFPAFRWRIGTLLVRGLAAEHRRVPVRLLDLAETERRRRRWDMVFVLSDTELETATDNSASILLSRAFATALIAADRLQHDSGDVDELGRALVRTVTYLAGANQPVARQGALRREPLEPDEIAGLEPALLAIADQRLEESNAAGMSRGGFVLRAIRLNAKVIAGAIRQARPWLLPFWLSGLSAAALSTLVVLIVTAEAWEIGTRLSAPRVLLLATLVIGFTSIFLVRRNNLLITSAPKAISELRVVSDTTSVICVALGMLTTFAGLFAIALAMGWLLFDPATIQAWTGLPPDGPQRAGMAGLVASIGLILGAFGATLEGQQRFRHLLHIDAELD